MDTQRTLSSIHIKEECVWPLFPEWLVGSWKVQLIIESVDNILQRNHSNQWNLFRQYFQILTLGIFQSKKVSTVEPCSPCLMTTSLIRPPRYYDHIFFDPNTKITESFYYFEDHVNATTLLLGPGFYSLTVVAFIGFYCTSPFVRKILDWRFLIYLGLCPFKDGFHTVKIRK